MLLRSCVLPAPCPRPQRKQQGCLEKGLTPFNTPSTALSQGSPCSRAGQFQLLIVGGINNVCRDTWFYYLGWTRAFSRMTIRICLFLFSVQMDSGCIFVTCFFFLTHVRSVSRHTCTVFTHSGSSFYIFFNTCFPYVFQLIF